MVLTSHDRLDDTGKKTGYWLEEFAAPLYVFVDHHRALSTGSHPWSSDAASQPPNANRS